MANITGDWNKSMPSGSSLVAQGDDLMRQHWASIQSTVEEEHYMSDSAASAGIHKPGSARIYTGLASSRSTIAGGPTAEGRLHYATDAQELHLLGTSATTKIAGKAFVGAYVGPATVAAYGIANNQLSPISYDDWNWNVGSMITSSATMVKIPPNMGGPYYVQCETAINSGDTHYGAGEKLSLYIETDQAGVGVIRQEALSTGTWSRIAVNSTQSLNAGTNVWARILTTRGSRITLTGGGATKLIVYRLG